MLLLQPVTATGDLLVCCIAAFVAHHSFIHLLLQYYIVYFTPTFCQNEYDDYNHRRLYQCMFCCTSLSPYVVLNIRAHILDVLMCNLPKQNNISHSNPLASINKEIVDSRLRPQSCCQLANCIEMQEIVDCKLSRIMNNSTYPNNPQEAIFAPVQKCPYHVTFDLDLDLEHSVDADLPGDHRVQVWWRSGHLPARSDGQCKFSTLCTLWTN